MLGLFSWPYVQNQKIIMKSFPLKVNGDFLERIALAFRASGPKFGLSIILPQDNM